MTPRLRTGPVRPNLPQVGHKDRRRSAPADSLVCWRPAPRNSAWGGPSEGRQHSPGEDEMHEQCNKDIQSDGEAVGILDDPSALMKWMVSGPGIANLLEQFDEEMGFSENKNNCVHNEDNLQYSICK
ncbi:hypothetical protein NDU88_003931 [Pleurodeles waltl]|uniref:Uncharacterized protein n=1 Tax=Pleurodeles waltl TaxID=8319 RepID=A0AAV7PAZ0_PLEWA|nr:hypothetical protein NDU88_003931 [Pleurodeles waltl]